MAVASFAEMYVQFQQMFGYAQNIQSSLDEAGIDLPQVRDLMRKVEDKRMRVEALLSSLQGKLHGTYYPPQWASNLAEDQWMTYSEFLVQFNHLVRLDYLCYHDRNIMRSLFKHFHKPPFGVEKYFKSNVSYICMGVKPAGELFAQVATLLYSREYDNELAIKNHDLFRSVLKLIVEHCDPHHPETILITSGNFESRTGIRWQNIAPAGFQSVRDFTLVNDEAQHMLPTSSTSSFSVLSHEPTDSEVDEVLREFLLERADIS